MELEEYFKNTKGLTILSTSGNEGNVDSAIYSAPRFLGNNQIGMIMREKQSYANISENPYACIIFVEEAEGYKGKRLYLKKTGETDDKSVIEPLLKRPTHGNEQDVKRHLVYFEIISERPLVGD